MSERSEKFDLSDLESALRELRPQLETLDRAALMYRAGRASARGWGWPLATLVSTALALTLGIALWIRPTPPVVYVAIPSDRDDEGGATSTPFPPEEESQRGGWSRYVRLQERVSLYGLDGLPTPPNVVEEQSLSVETLLHSMQ